MMTQLKIYVLLLVAFNALAMNVHAGGYSFGDAAEGYTNFGYDFDGSIKSNGELYVPGKLSCSGYVCVMMHRMWYGSDWKGSKFESKVCQWRGPVIAKHFNLSLDGYVPSGSVSKSGLEKMINDKKLKKGLYLFNVTSVTRYNASKNKSYTPGHVGFVRIKSDGSAIQSHYSQTGNGGLPSGDFFSWYSSSMYADDAVELYFIAGK